MQTEPRASEASSICNIMMCSFVCTLNFIHSLYMYGRTFVSIVLLFYRFVPMQWCVHKGCSIVEVSAVPAGQKPFNGALKTEQLTEDAHKSRVKRSRPDFHQQAFKNPVVDCWCWGCANTNSCTPVKYQQIKHLVRQQKQVWGLGVSAGVKDRTRKCFQSLLTYWISFFL